MAMIPLDEFTSASGIYRCVLTTRFEANLNGQMSYWMVTYFSGTNHIHMIHRICLGDAQLAWQLWFEWRQKFENIDPTKRYEDDMPAGVSAIAYSPPYLIEEDYSVLRMRPQGPRIFVRDITPVDEVTSRAEKAGLVAVVAEENKPKPTMGIVLKVGEDPLARELYKEGMIVMFSRYAGNTFSESGEQYRSLELHEIIGSRVPEDGIEDLLPPQVRVDPSAHLGAREPLDEPDIRF
jgi:co-chaperonin GroES (HSP10)